MTLSLSVPANGWVSSPFGPRNIPSSPFHHGIDYGWLVATRDYQIFAAAPGTVSQVFFNTTMGHCIEIDHGGGFRTRYCHLADAGLVSVGQSVVRRQHIGTMGSTGTAADGERHLHFELWQNGNRIDPAPYMTGTAGDGGTPIEEKSRDMQGAFPRDKKSGKIYWQEKPNTALIPLDVPTWAAWSAQGNTYTDLDPADIAALIKAWGTAPAPVAASGGGSGVSAGQVAAEADRVIDAMPKTFTAQ